MSIFILEDDYIQAYQLKELIQKICDRQGILYDFIEVTSRANELLEKITTCKRVPIYFLDLEIKGEERKGLEIAREIRKIDIEGIIVFITTHSELAPISYQYMVSALTFIDKNTPSEEKKKWIEQCLEQYRLKNEDVSQEQYFILENEYTTIRVPFKSIEYFMTDESHRLKLVTTNRYMQFYGKLKDIEEMDTHFIRCHQSYVINELQIESFHQTSMEVILKSGKSVPVSRRQVKKMKQYIKEGCS